MPTIPISAMTAATQFNTSDVFPIVQAGANLKCTRALLLAAVAGETISLTGGGSNFTIAINGDQECLLAANRVIKIWNGNAGKSVTFGPDGDCAFNVGATKNFNVVHGTGAQLLLDNLGNFQMLGAAGAAIFLSVGANSMTFIDGGGIAFTADAGVVVIVPYVDGTTGVWKMAPPPDFNTAIDRLANAVSGLLGGLIP